MAPISSPSSHATTGTQVKRRKLRKGTQSCWECKRRKMRCIFPSSTDTVCSACQRRGSPCVGQDIAVENPPASGSRSGRHSSKRLERVEALPGNVFDQTTADKRLLEYSQQNAGQPVEASVDIQHQGEHALGGSPVATDPKLDRALRASWPGQNEMKSISMLAVDVAEFFHIASCLKHSPKTLPKPSRMLHLPPPGAQSVLTAKSLLVLAVFLTCARPQATQFRQVELRAVETARRLFTSQDELVGSILGIECIMLEACYENHAGNLRRAWSVCRRAMTTAQILGLHKAQPVSSPNQELVSGSQENFLNPDQVWLRLVGMDRYLCLMLGLPPGSHDNHDTMTLSCPELLSLPPMERMLRLHCIVAWRIFHRSDHSNLEATWEATTDEMLQHASGCVPAQWWLIPCLSDSNSSDRDKLTSLDRMLGQLSHYHLLVQLYLPYILLDSTEYFYKKLTAVNASREVLVRFLTVRNNASEVPNGPGSPSSSFCRGIDFISFISCTALCLAHMTSRRDPGDDSAMSRFLGQQRCSDRALMERTLESLQQAASPTGGGNDAIACGIVAILKPLLDINADVMNGSSSKKYCAATTPHIGSLIELGCGGDISEGGSVLRVRIPHFGVIAIRSTSASELEEAEWQDSLPLWWNASMPCFSQMLGCMDTVPMAEGGSWDLQGEDTALFANIVRESTS